MPRLRLLGLAAAIAVIGGLAPQPPVLAATFVPPAVVRTIGGPGHAGVYAWGAATAKDGTILIGDYWNYVIRRYSTTGQLLQTFSSKGSALGQNQAPHGLAVDPNDGSIYEADMNAPREVDKFDANGNPVRTISMNVPGVTVPYAYVTHIAVNRQGWLYAVSSHNVPLTFQNRIVVFNPDGTYRFSFGTNGTADGQFGLLRGIGIGPNDEVYVADTGKGKVQVFSRDGVFLRSFGQGRFTGDMRGVTVDADDGWVYVSDTNGNQVEKFDLSGNWLATWGSKGTGNGQFGDGPREIAIGPDNNVFVTDFGNNRVNVYTPTGAFVRFFPNPPTPPPDGGFNLPAGVAVSPNGANVYVADTFNHRIQRFSPAGNFVGKWGTLGKVAPGQPSEPYSLNYPRGVAVEPGTGDVWVANSRQGDIKRYSSTGTFKSSFGLWGTASGQYQLPRGIAVGSDDRVYIADSNNKRVQVTTKTGAVLQSLPCGIGATGTGNGLLQGCTGVAVDSGGNIYAAAVSENAVYKWNSAGVLVAKWGTTGSSNGQLRGAYGVAIFGGNVYVSEMFNNRVSVFDTDGTFVGKFLTRGSDPGQVVEPAGISVDGAGNLYVTDGKNERVNVYKIQ